jgi:hypothetical protein
VASHASLASHHELISSFSKTRKYCKCELIKFDQDKAYANAAPHIANLHTYAWKPLLIAETLKTHDYLIYMDSSIRMQSGGLEPVMSAVESTGILTQYIGLSFPCYTHPRMFEWFGETVELYEHMWTIEANIFVMHKNLINALIMRAWVACAMDETCIAPPGSSIGGCCG